MSANLNSCVPDVGTGRTMSTPLNLLALCAASCLVAGEAVHGQRIVGTRFDSSILTTNATFRAGIERIAARSSLWQQAIQDLRNTGRYAVVLTPEQVVVADEKFRKASAFDPSVLAETAPVPLPTAAVNVVLVVVNLPLLEGIHRSRNSLPAEFETDLDRILIHEVYGHAFPYLAAGNLSGRCPDPLPKQRPSDACSIQRENEVRAELGLGRRVDYGLYGLMLGRRMIQ